VTEQSLEEAGVTEPGVCVSPIWGHELTWGEHYALHSDFDPPVLSDVAMTYEELFLETVESAPGGWQLIELYTYAAGFFSVPDDIAVDLRDWADGAFGGNEEPSILLERSNDSTGALLAHYELDDGRQIYTLITRIVTSDNDVYIITSFVAESGVDAIAEFEGDDPTPDKDKFGGAGRTFVLNVGRLEDQGMRAA
jgi:hypothetical protein